MAGATYWLSGWRVRVMRLRDFLNNTPKVRFGRLIQKLTYPAIASFIGFIGTSQPGQALTFKFNYAEHTPQHTITAFEEAGAIWARHLQGIRFFRHHGENCIIGHL